MFDLDTLGDWRQLPFFDTMLPAIAAKLAGASERVLPPVDLTFRALSLTPPEAVRVVVLGQDPYPTPGHANGLAFSVQPDVTPLPRSLKNIYLELQDDQGKTPPNGDLSGWARQGVLLLNTVLTVPSGEAGGHRGIGWEALTDQVIARVSARAPTAFVLWGRPAQARAKAIIGDTHLVIESPHPSPLSARRGFFGSRPFGQINQWLETQGQTRIDWGRKGEF